MKDFENALGSWVIRHRLWIIAVTILVLIVSVMGASQLSLITNYRVFFSEDNPQLLAFEALEKTYAKNDNVLFVLSPKNGQVFTKETLKAITDITEQSWQIPYSTRVDSISNFQYTHAEEDDLIVEDLISEPESLSPAELAEKKTIALAEPLLKNRLINPSASVAGVNITVQLPGINPTKENPAVVDFSRKIAEKISASYPNIEVRLAGMVMMNHAFTEASQNDFKSLVPISYGLMLIFLMFLIRSITGTVITLLVILLSVITALGTAGWIGYPITPPTTSTPVIILTIAIASSVHLLVTFFHELHRGKDRFESIIETLRINFQPIALTSFTTALGFLSMNFSEVPPFVHLGNIVAIGVIASFFLVILLMPAVLSFIPLRPKIIEKENDPLMLVFSRFVIKYRNTLLVSMVSVDHYSDIFYST